MIADGVSVAIMVSIVMAIMMTVMVSVMMSVVAYVEVGQHKEAREPKIPPPKRIRDPAIKVCIIRRRRIIRYHRGPLVIIVIGDYLGFRIIRGVGHIRCSV